jgi:uncharacterized lipoprotein YddW (UPF0748 family)
LDRKVAEGHDCDQLKNDGEGRGGKGPPRDLMQDWVRWRRELKELMRRLLQRFESGDLTTGGREIGEK